LPEKTGTPARKANRAAVRGKPPQKTANEPPATKARLPIAASAWPETRPPGKSPVGGHGAVNAK